MMEKYIEEVKASGVENAGEIYEKMKAKVAEYDAAH